MHQRSVTPYDEILDLFTLGIVNVGELCSVANALQERRFASVRPADDKDSETTNSIEVLFDFSRIQMARLTNAIEVLFDFSRIQMRHCCKPWGVVWYHVCTH